MKVFGLGHPDIRDVAAVQDKRSLSEGVFNSMLRLEHLRAKRSLRPFVLMLLDAKQENGAAARILKEAAAVVLISKRETDLLGWYKENAILGVIFVEVSVGGVHPITETLRFKIERTLTKHLGSEQAAKVSLSPHMFPEGGGKDQPRSLELACDLRRRDLRSVVARLA
jgi:hypothetical protein